MQWLTTKGRWVWAVKLMYILSHVSAYEAEHCLRSHPNHILLEMCPTSDTFMSDPLPALFPDPMELSNLSSEEPDEHYNPIALDPYTNSAHNPDNNNEPTLTIDPLPASPLISVPTPSVSNMDIATIERTEERLKIEKNPLMSFEEWQKNFLQPDNTENERRHKRKPAGSGERHRQMIDSLDGAFSDDFGAVFEGNHEGAASPENTYEEGEYISPTRNTENGRPKDTKRIPGKKPQFADIPLNALKERFNYASTDCAATVRSANKEARGTQSILYESKDQYMLNKCYADKYVTIHLCEDILIDTIVLANFEFFSSTFKDFRVYASHQYPTKDWVLLGQWRARNTRDQQVFKVLDKNGWFEYIKIEFLNHYGNEYYCPLSLVRVHGMPMMEYYNLVERQGLSPDDLDADDEHLWPADVRDAIIQPQGDVTNTSESFPIRQDTEDEPTIILPVHLSDLEEEEHQDHDMDSMKENLFVQESTSTVVTEDTKTSATLSPKDNATFTPEATQESESITLPDDIISPVLTNNSAENASQWDGNVNGTEEMAPDTLNITSSRSEPAVTPSNASTPVYIEEGESVTSSTSGTSSGSLSSMDEARPAQARATHGGHTKEASTQESIYKTIMKRLNALELNTTLSQRYLEDQNRILNDVFKDMEKRHQEQLFVLISRLNETATTRIDGMKRRYDQWYEELKEETDREMRQMTVKLSLLEDQIAFERRVSISQIVIVVTLFVFVALSRGTFHMLSPIMIAQAEERKRRESTAQENVYKRQAVDLAFPKVGELSTKISRDEYKDHSPGRARSVSTESGLMLSSSLSRLSLKTPPSKSRRNSDNLSDVLTSSMITPIETSAGNKEEDSDDTDACVPAFDSETADEPRSA